MAVSLSEYHVEMQYSIDQQPPICAKRLEQLEIQNVELDIAKKTRPRSGAGKIGIFINMSHELRSHSMV